ncbi:DUF3710 domain-containing protein [Nonomuraea sp. NPDC050556]|uniref:DUF3710 domain-containing protein n=1 Tax=Nonomuraea sp. NPDC050556 TaxID=3364369 RepID=UPI0037AC0236
MFRRRRREQSEAAESVAPAEMRESGPWDSAEPHPESDRIDLGGLRLPSADDLDIRLAMVGDQPVGAIVLHEESALQLHAFAAPKTSGLWDEARTKISAAVKEAGGSLEQQDGPFGPELAGQVNSEGSLERVRYIGVDGPRWFLRAVISGRAAMDEKVAARLEDVIRDVVVVRGDDPMAREESIPLRKPSDNPAQTDEQETLNPFKRGPEISETR